MKTMIIALVCLLIIISAAGGYFYMQKPATAEVHVEPVAEAYSAYVDVIDIYFSSNNGKRTKLVVIDLSIEVNNEQAKIKLKDNIPKIKGAVLNILSLQKYKETPDHLLLNFINDNVKKDLMPTLKEISQLTTGSHVYVTRLIIQ